MIKIPLVFSIEEAAKLLQEAGLTVVKEEHKDESDIQLNYPVSIYKVKNPHNGALEEVEVIFRKYIIQRMNKLFLTPDKLEIYELFDKSQLKKIEL